MTLSKMTENSTKSLNDGNLFEEDTLQPDMYDGIVFFPTKNGMTVDYICFKDRPEAFPVGAATPCQVMLYSFKDSKVELVGDFRAHFTDPKTYVRGLCHSGIMFGCMIRESEISKSFIDLWQREGITLIEGQMEHKWREEYLALPFWTRVRFWFRGFRELQREE